MKKRIISILLTACMITALLPVMGNGVFAAGGLTRAEWITQLVAAFEMTVEDDSNMPDNYFSDISEEDSYYRDILLAVEFGVIDLEAGKAFEPSEPATREFAAQTLNACLKYQLDEGTEYTFSESETVTYPDDIQVAINRGWFTLSGGNFLPEQAITSAEAEAMLTDAKTTIAGDTVEENYNSQYEFADGVIVVPETADVTIEGEYTVTIANWDGTISENDIFVVYSYGIPVPLKAETVETGEATVITATKEGTDDAIVSADSQGITDVDLEDFEANELTTYSLMSVDGNDSEELDIQLQSISYDAKTKMLTAKHDVKIQDGLAGSITVEIGNLKLNHKENTSVGSYEAFLTGNASVTKNFYFDFGDWVGVPNHITIGYVNIGGVGSISLDVDLSLSGGITEVEKGTITAGFSYGRHDGFRLVCGYKKTYYSFEADAKVKLGLTLSLNIDLVFVKGRAWLTIGTECSYNKKDFTYVDGQNPIKCETIKGHLYANAGAKISLTYIVDKTLWEYRYDIYTESNSPLRVCYHYEDGELVDHCARSKDGNEAYTKYTTKISSAYFNPSPNYAKSSYGGSGSTSTPVVVWEYKVEDGNATITGYKGNASALAIPSTIDGYTVTKIGSGVFRDNKTIRSVVIPNSVTTIDASSFENCSNLSNVSLSNNLATLNRNAFGNCTSLTDIKIPKSLKTCGYSDMGNYYVPFSGSGLKNISFENGITKIPDNIFMNCTELETIAIPDGVVELGGHSFSRCTKLKNILLPDTLLKIQGNAFEGCTALEHIKLPDYLTEVGGWAFYGCTNLSDIQLSKSLETLGGRTFGNCTSLSDIEIPKSLIKCGYSDMGNYYVPFSGSGLKNISFENGITKIPDNIFMNCTELETITIPDGVVELGGHSFSRCTKLKNVLLPDTLLKIQGNAFEGCTALEDVEMPDSLIEIDGWAFYGCTGLSNLKLSKNLVHIGRRAFQNCIALKSLYIPKSLSDIDYYDNYDEGAFAYTGLENITFENGISKIPDNLFVRCTKLKNITIPEGVTEIGGSAFEQCIGLEDITLPETLIYIGRTDNYSSSYDVFYGCTSLSSIHIPDGVKEIGGRTFKYCTSLKEIDIPNSVTDIGNSILSDCTSLEKAHIPDIWQNINSDTFYNCKNLTEINIPSTLIAIRDNAFSGCEKLKLTPLPDNLTTIEAYAFYNCKALTEITIPEKVTSIGSSVFENCDGLQTATVNGSGSIGQKAFYDCDALVDLTISDNITSIGSEICYSCDKLTNVKLGRGITTIPNSAFRQCASLTEITLPRFCTTVAANAFAEDVKLATVNVPVSVSKIETNSFSYPAKMTFNGKTGSYAEEYASSRNIKFNAVDAPITNIKYADSKMSIGTDTTVLPALTIEPGFDTDTVTFKSSDENILTVSDTGSVKSGWRNYGTAKITATTGSGKSTSIDITVVKTADSIGLDNSSLNLDLGISGKLTATMSPSDAVDVLEWSSSNSDIAEVDQDGNVTAKAKGTAVITVKASYSGVSATCTVTVIPPAEITAFTVDESENGYTANITTADVPAGAAVWIAAYDENNALVGIQKVAANKAVQAEFDTPDAANFKAFVWNMTTLKPLTSSREAPVITGV